MFDMMGAAEVCLIFPSLLLGLTNKTMISQSQSQPNLC